MSSNYPPGAASDPRAPWNYDDDEPEHDRYCATSRGRRCDCDTDD